MRKTLELIVVFLVLLAFSAFADAACSPDPGYSTQQQLWTWEPTLAKCSVWPATIFHESEQAIVSFDFSFNLAKYADGKNAKEIESLMKKRFAVRITSADGKEIKVFSANDFTATCTTQRVSTVLDCNFFVSWNAAEVKKNEFYYARILYDFDADGNLADAERAWGPLELFPTNENCGSCIPAVACTEKKCESLGDCVRNSRIAQEVSKSVCYPRAFQKSETGEQKQVKQPTPTPTTKKDKARLNQKAEVFTEGNGVQRAKALLAFALQQLSLEEQKIKKATSTPNSDLFVSLVRQANKLELSLSEIRYEKQGVEKILTSLENTGSLQEMMPMFDAFQKNQLNQYIQKNFVEPINKKTSTPVDRSTGVDWSTLQSFKTEPAKSSSTSVSTERIADKVSEEMPRTMEAGFNNPIVYAVFKKEKENKYSEADEAGFIIEKANSFEKSAEELNYARAFVAYSLAASLYADSGKAGAAKQGMNRVWERVKPPAFQSGWLYNCLAPLTDLRWLVAGTVIGATGGAPIISVVFLGVGTKGLNDAVGDLAGGQWRTLSDQEKVDAGLQVGCSATILAIGWSSFAKAFAPEAKEYVKAWKEAKGTLPAEDVKQAKIVSEVSRNTEQAADQTEQTKAVTPPMQQATRATRTATDLPQTTPPQNQILVEVGQEQYVLSGVTEVGRVWGPLAEVLAKDEKISRRQGYIRVEGEKTFFTDVGSKNGFAVERSGKTKIYASGKTAELRPGDVLELGDTRLKFDGFRDLDTPMLIEEEVPSISRTVQPLEDGWGSSEFEFYVDLNSPEIVALRSTARQLRSLPLDKRIVELIKLCQKTFPNTEFTYAGKRYTLSSRKASASLPLFTAANQEIPFSSFVKAKAGVCRHYSTLFKILTDEANVPALIELGNLQTAGGNEYHAWDVVQISENDWQRVDACWGFIQGKSKSVVRGTNLKGYGLIPQKALPEAN